jgi:hypothetical protein
LADPSSRLAWRWFSSLIHALRLLLSLRVHAQLWGLLIGAPAAHFWHAYLQKWFARKADTFDTAIQKVTRAQLHCNPTLQWKTLTSRPPSPHQLLRQLRVTVMLLLLQVVLDQLTFGPAYNLAFMAYTSMVVHSECAALQTAVECAHRRQLSIMQHLHAFKGVLIKPCVVWCGGAGVPPAAFKHKVVQEFPSLQLNGWKVRPQQHASGGVAAPRTAPRDELAHPLAAGVAAAAVGLASLTASGGLLTHRRGMCCGVCCCRCGQL